MHLNVEAGPKMTFAKCQMSKNSLYEYMKQCHLPVGRQPF